MQYSCLYGHYFKCPFIDKIFIKMKTFECLQFNILSEYKIPKDLVICLGERERAKCPLHEWLKKHGPNIFLKK